MVVALLETKVSLQSIGMFFKTVSLNTTSVSPQAIHATVRKDGFEEWLFSAIYASPNSRLRDILWEDLDNIVSSTQLP